MNRAKYILNMTLSIILIVIAALNATMHLIAAIMNMNANAYNSTLLSILSAVMAAANFALAAIAAAMCFKTNKRAGVDIYIIVSLLLLSISFMSIIMRTIENPNSYFYIEFIVYAGLIALSLVALFKKNTPDKVKVQPQAESSAQAKPMQPAELTLSYKISQIKRMRELCLVSDEQVQEAINRLIDAEMKK